MANLHMYIWFAASKPAFTLMWTCTMAISSLFWIVTWYSFNHISVPCEQHHKIIIKYHGIYRSTIVLYNTMTAPCTLQYFLSKFTKVSVILCNIHSSRNQKLSHTPTAETGLHSRDQTRVLQRMFTVLCGFSLYLWNCGRLLSLFLIAADLRVHPTFFNQQ